MPLTLTNRRVRTTHSKQERQLQPTILITLRRQVGAQLLPQHLSPHLLLKICMASTSLLSLDTLNAPIVQEKSLVLALPLTWKDV